MNVKIVGLLLSPSLLVGVIVLVVVFSSISTAAAVSTLGFLLADGIIVESSILLCCE